jgi:hypothetical protein
MKMTKTQSKSRISSSSNKTGKKGKLSKHRFNNRQKEQDKKKLLRRQNPQRLRNKQTKIMKRGKNNLPVVHV